MPLSPVLPWPLFQLYQHCHTVLNYSDVSISSGRGKVMVIRNWKKETGQDITGQMINRCSECICTCSGNGKDMEDF